MAPFCPDDKKYAVVEAMVKEYTALKDKGETLLGRKITSVVTVNGVRVTLDDGTWGLVRASSNKPSLVVVVESHRNGGSLYTAEAAARRSIPVCAVPGSVHSRASDGTNELLVDGCTPVRDVDDVLAAVSLARQGKGKAPLESVRTGSVMLPDQGIALDRIQRAVWEAVEDVPTTVETVLLRTDLSLSALLVAGDELVERGLLTSGSGWWSRA